MKKFLAFAALLAASTTANASITVVLTGTQAAGSNTQYNYEAQQTTGDTILVNDYFTIYDFQGFVTALAPAGWAYSTQLQGITPATQLVTDNASISNVTFTKTTAPTEATSILGFSIVTSSDAPSVLGVFSGRNHKNSGATVNEANGDVGVPGASAVPEPATMGLMGGALLGLGLLARRRK